MTSALVTGASGMLGSALVPVLEARGTDVWTTARTDIARNNHITADLTDTAAAIRLADVIPDVTVHLAGRVNGSAQELRQANVVTTERLMQSLDAGSRIIVVGSAAEYGSGTGRPLRESDELKPSNAYGRAKAEQTTRARAIADERGISLTVVRPFNVIGPDLPPTTALGNYRHQISAQEGAASTQVEVGRLDILRDFVAISFVTSALASIVADVDSGPTYNICSGIGISLKDILQAMGTLARTEIIERTSEELASLPAPSVVVGDPTLLELHYGLTHRPTPLEIASIVLDLCP